MARHIVNLNECILNMLVKQRFTTAQISYFHLIQAFNNLDFVEIIINDGVINNEIMIETLHKDYNIPLLTKSNYIKILNYCRIDEYTKNGYFIYRDRNGIEYIAVNNLGTLPKLLLLNDSSKIKLIKKQDFSFFLEENFHHLNLIKSKYFLEFISKSKTAKNINYMKVLTGFFIVFFFTFINFINFFYIINNICYFLENCLKIYLFKRTIINIDTKQERHTNLILPIYTILVPLYKENGKIQSIINNINAINYPKHKLDIKFIIEEDDHLTIKEFVTINLPDHIQTLKVPFSLPRTKPKALNYAMQYVQGEYLVVYDAEDKPHPDQLLDALIAFAHLPSEYVCEQAKLNFYNKDENLLTKLFSIEL